MWISLFQILSHRIQYLILNKTKNDENVIYCKKDYEIEIALKAISECTQKLPFHLHTIVDVGCGQGNLLASLPKSCPSVGHFIGIDRNNDLIEKERKRFQERERIRRKYEL